MSAGQPGCDKVDLDDLAPDRGVEFPGGRIAAGDTGVVDQDVDPAGFRECISAGGRNRGIIGEFDNPGIDRPN